MAIPDFTKIISDAFNQILLNALPGRDPTGPLEQVFTQPRPSVLGAPQDTRGLAEAFGDFRQQLRTSFRGIAQAAGGAREEILSALPGLARASDFLRTRATEGLPPSERSRIRNQFLQLAASRGFLGAGPETQAARILAATQQQTQQAAASQLGQLGNIIAQMSGAQLNLPSFGEFAQIQLIARNLAEAILAAQQQSAIAANLLDFSVDEINRQNRPRVFVGGFGAPTPRRPGVTATVRANPPSPTGISPLRPPAPAGGAGAGQPLDQPAAFQTASFFSLGGTPGGGATQEQIEEAQRQQALTRQQLGDFGAPSAITADSQLEQSVLGALDAPDFSVDQSFLKQFNAFNLFNDAIRPPT